MLKDEQRDYFQDHKLRNQRQVHIFMKELWPQLRDEIAGSGKTLCVAAPYRNVLSDLVEALCASGDFKDTFSYYRHNGDLDDSCPRLVIARKEGASGKLEHIRSFDHVCFLPIADRVEHLGAIELAYRQAREWSHGITWVIGSASMLDKLGVAQSTETRFSSIFDYASQGIEATDGKSKPETCFRKALEDKRVRELLCRRAVAVFSELPLRCLMVAGNQGEKEQPLLDYLQASDGEQADIFRYAYNLARFDFAFVTRSQPHRLLLVVEIDGEQHRYGWRDPAADLVGTAKESIKKNLEISEGNDYKKNSIVELLGGTVISQGRDGVCAANDKKVFEGMPSTPVLYRLPTNGSSAFEIDSLKSGGSKEESEYFTLEDLISYCTDGARDKDGPSDAPKPQILVQDLPGIREERVYGEKGLGFVEYVEALRWLEEKGFIMRAETAGWLPGKNRELDTDGIRMGITSMLFIDDADGGEMVWMCRFPDFALQRLSDWRNQPTTLGSREDA